VQVEVQAGRHAEVAPSTAEAPEEIRVLIGTCLNHGPVRSHDLCSDEVVARQAVLRGQVADAAAEAEPADAGGADDASGRDEADRLGGRVEIEPGRAAVGVGDPGIAVHLDRPHQREVDHEPVVDDAVSGGIVPASPHGHVQPLRTCESERGRDIAGAEATRDHRRPAVDESVEAAARRVVPGVRGADHRPGQRLPQLVQARHLSRHEPAGVVVGIPSLLLPHARVVVCLDPRWTEKSSLAVAGTG
jgi:hypothetical protein